MAWRRFYTDGLLYYDSMNLVFQTENEKGKKQPYKFLLDPFNSPPQPAYSFTSFTPFDATKYLAQQAEEKHFLKSTEIKVLKDVVVTAKKEPDSRLIGFSGDAVIKVKNNDVGFNRHHFSNKIFLV